eukprot:TRINITY_DN71987_c0_g1_i1.p1 TRINITY_DN71987_c0_g1~~TRINITY_DN71987_c0_g1_i1.p1  ORF type:complete len:683 (+),score=176.94 TRINITY_DN71987_c0_g1_i1:71-2050(+)
MALTLRSASPSVAPRFGGLASLTPEDIASPAGSAADGANAAAAVPSGASLAGTPRSSGPAGYPPPAPPGRSSRRRNGTTAESPSSASASPAAAVAAKATTLTAGRGRCSRRAASSGVSEEGDAASDDDDAAGGASDDGGDSCADADVASREPGSAIVAAAEASAPAPAAVKLPPVLPSTRGARSSSCPAGRGNVGASGSGAAAMGRGIRLELVLTAQFDGAQVDVELTEGETIAAQSFPLTVDRGEALRVGFLGARRIAGVLRVRGAPEIPFGAGGGGGSGASGGNFVAQAERHRTTAVDAGELDADSGLAVKGEGVAVEASITAGAQAELAVLIRKAKKKELTRIAQRRSLLKAMESQKYSSLLAQITKAKMRKVEAALIDQASLLLKSIKPAETAFLSHSQLKKAMRWKLVTTQVTPESVTDPCSASSECPCNAGFAQAGEVCTVSMGMAAEALQGVVPQGADYDKWFFKALVRAAQAVPEGCVWKSGGKFLLTNEERNQSANAIVGVLERDAAAGADAAAGMRALIEYTEKEFKYRVTAVQLNFHPNEKSSHKQHRDIYGAGQKGGMNCTCSFMKCTGTVCYSFGSSRKVMCETMTDNRSKYAACGDGCTGCRTYKWMHSGSAMFFNDKWNNNHTHGVPLLDEPTGPRISVALLCA